jgi:hypothetical protein
MSFRIARSCSCRWSKVNPLHTLVWVGESVAVVGAKDGSPLGEIAMKGFFDGCTDTVGILVGTVAIGALDGSLLAVMTGVDDGSIEIEGTLVGTTTIGATDGLLLGETATTGFADGSLVIGTLEGTLLGEVMGVDDGFSDMLGLVVGTIATGFSVGDVDTTGFLERAKVGRLVGLLVGSAIVGVADSGTIDGEKVGDSESDEVGLKVGTATGTDEGVNDDENSEGLGVFDIVGCFVAIGLRVGPLQGNKKTQSISIQFACRIFRGLIDFTYWSRSKCIHT